MSTGSDRYRRIWAIGAAMSLWLGCRGHQFGHIIQDDQSDMVGSHAAGAETINPLVEEAVAKLLARQGFALGNETLAVTSEQALPVKRVCFIGVENCSAEELGDFKEQMYELIDSQIASCASLQSVSRRYVDAGLARLRVRPDALFIPENMHAFAGVMAQQGQPFDYLLFAKLTSGTTEKNKSYQRDYLLTLEMVNVESGHFDKESAKVRKGYHATRLGKIWNFNPFTRR